jgi:hypothetical protein
MEVLYLGQFGSASQVKQMSAAYRAVEALWKRREAPDTAIVAEGRGPASRAFSGDGTLKLPSVHSSKEGARSLLQA